MHFAMRTRSSVEPRTQRLNVVEILTQGWRSDGMKTIIIEGLHDSFNACLLLDL